MVSASLGSGRAAFKDSALNRQAKAEALGFSRISEEYVISKRTIV